MNHAVMNAFMPISASGVTYPGYGIRPSTSTQATGIAHFYRRTTVSQNVERLTAAFARAMNDSSSNFDATEKIAAEKAVAEAISVISALVFSEMPWVGVTDDCTAMVQWQLKDEGVVFSFTGQQVFGMASKKGADSRYSDNYQEGTVDDALPSEIRDAIVTLSQMRDVPTG
jgi:hypothetical protein